MNDQQRWDLFVSHAWEDKEPFVRQLVGELQARGLHVWYDEFELTVGDSLRGSIDHGLANSRFGIVVLSRAFFAKGWPTSELNSLVTRQNSERRKVILPIWHGVSAEDVRSFSPLLADQMGVSTDRGMEHVVEEIVRATGKRELYREVQSTTAPVDTSDLLQPNQLSLPSSTATPAPPWLEGIEGVALPRLINSNAHIIRVIAGPGSGKTTGLKRRVIRLVQSNGVAPDRILVVTFTRVIAKELSGHLKTTADFDEIDGDPGGVEVSTLHSLAFRLLRDYPAVRGGRALRFLLEYEKRAMLSDIQKRLNFLPDLAGCKKQLLKLVAGWAQGRSLADEEFEGELDRWLRWHRGMLTDEVVHLVRRALESGDIPKGMFDHVIVDEYQDLTATEQEVVEQLWSRRGSLVVLGDDDQSIYSFRYNHRGGITDFLTRWAIEEIEDIRLPENHRSGTEIVSLANVMMAQAGSSKQPMIPTGREASPPIQVHWPSVQAEIVGVSEYIKAKSDSKFLVLTPRRFIGYRLKALLGDEAETAFHEQSLDHPLVRERLIIASLIANQEDLVALRAWFALKGSDPHEAQSRNAEAYAVLMEQPRTGRDLVEAIVRDEVRLRGAGSRNIKTRARLLVDILNAQHSVEFETVVNWAFDPSVATGIEDKEEQARIVGDLEELRATCLKIAEELHSENLARVLGTLRYRIETRLTGSGTSRVRIMTLYGAKGLESDIVLVVGVADQIVPGIAEEDQYEDKLKREEQRRLLYVAVTRAKRELILSWPQEIPLGEAKRNQVRVDGQIWTNKDGKKVTRLTRSSLLPNFGSQSRPIPGESWLRTSIDK